MRNITQAGRGHNRLRIPLAGLLILAAFVPAAGCGG